MQKTGTCALIDTDQSVRDQLLSLCDADFPDDYRDMAHPEDYTGTVECFPPKALLHKRPQHNRLLLRICWKFDEDRFVPVTFVCDTGSPGTIYLCKRRVRWRITNLCMSTCFLTVHLSVSYRARQVLASRIATTPGCLDECAVIDGQKAMVQPTPARREAANVLGLGMLARLGLSIGSADGPRFDGLALPHF